MRAVTRPTRRPAMQRRFAAPHVDVGLCFAYRDMRLNPPQRPFASQMT